MKDGRIYPLLEAFLELRRRNFPVGVQEYLDALRALAAGFGEGSREKLIFMCQVLWAKSPEERAQVAEAVQAALPRKLTEADYSALLHNLEESISGRDAWGPDRDDINPFIVGGEAQPAEDEDTDGRGGQERTYLVELEAGSDAASMEIPMPWIRTVAINQSFDLEGRFPVTKRQMKRAWRYFRLMQRRGQPVVLDVETTLERMYRQGVFLSPVLVPRRLNVARVLILVDKGGSMVPFEKATRALLESAAHSGLSEAAIYYFHDVPLEFIYADEQFSRPVPLERLLYVLDGAGVLIVSDAGAARGGHDDARVEQTGRMMQAVRQHSPNVAWLNPTPEGRWPGTTAGDIRAKYSVDMFTLDGAGLYSTVEVLRGRGRSWQQR